MSNHRTIVSQTRSWLQHQYELAQLCNEAPEADASRHLRALYALLRTSPCPTWLEGLAVPDKTRFEAMLLAGCPTEAALSLLGRDCGFMHSRGSEGRHLASIILPGRMEEATASGESAALAIAAALSLSLCDLPMLPGEAADLHDGPDLRLN